MTTAGRHVSYQSLESDRVLPVGVAYDVSIGGAQWLQSLRVPEQVRLRCHLGVSGEQDRGRTDVHPQDERVVVGVRPCAVEAAFRTEDVDPDVAYQEERPRAGVPERDGSRPHGGQK